MLPSWSVAPGSRTSDARLGVYVRRAGRTTLRRTVTEAQSGVETVLFRSYEPRTPHADASTMSLDEARPEAQRLAEQLRHHSFLYHIEARPEITDDEYDSIFRRLQAIEAAYPEL